MSRWAWGLLHAFCLLGIAAEAPAQTPYPAKPIRVLVPYAPGGLTDVVARLYSEQLRQSLGRGVFVENKPGASGIVAIDRRQIDDVERGADDSDWQPAKDAARELAFAEDRAIFDGYPAAGIEGIRQGTSNPRMTLPADVLAYPDAIARALTQLRLVGVNGPYSVLLSADAYTGLSETSDHGYPVLEHIKRLVDGEIIWAPAIAGAFVLTTRGGDFDFHIGQDISIGYLSHTDTVVRLYLQETFTFLLLTSEAAVALNPAASA